MNFTRGQDPFRSMHIGIITWNNLDKNCFLKTKKLVPFVIDSKNWGEYNHYNWGEYNHYKFCCDGAKREELIPIGIYIRIEEIKKEKNIIEIKYTSNWDMKSYSIKIQTGFYWIKGPLERFKKYFNIIQNH